MKLDIHFTLREKENCGHIQIGEKGTLTFQCGTSQQNSREHPTILSTLKSYFRHIQIDPAITL
jgi:hypothetical protein